MIMVKIMTMGMIYHQRILNYHLRNLILNHLEK
jgi:hypothetical protein